MAKIGLIFTTDYEIFGNGSGCVRKCMLEPTTSMATLLEEVGARLTIFFDVCEYWAFEEEFRSGKLREDWAGLIKAQLQDLVRRGHDVQLHFHPQWLDYSFDGTNWKLNYDLWRIGKLKYRNEEYPERGLENLFVKGKQTLEGMFRPINPDYKCNVFRAGAWSMQPEEGVLRAMQENGFIIDSTVAPGLAFQDEFTRYNFENAPLNRPVYSIQDNLITPEPNGKIWEVPIFTVEVPLMKRLRFLWLKRRRNLLMKPQGCKGSAIAASRRNYFQKVSSLLSQKRLMFNYSDAATFEEMQFFVNSAMRLWENESGSAVPVVAISHPKTFANGQELKKLLEWLSIQENVTFTTFNEIPTS